MQKILEEAPYYVDKASDASRLFLVRTKGSLSGGTPVKLVTHDGEYNVLTVAGRTQVKVSTAPYYKVVMEEVEVTLDDLVIRRMQNHPDVIVGGNGTATKKVKNRKARRKEEQVTQAVLEELKAKHAK